MKGMKGFKNRGLAFPLVLLLAAAVAACGGEGGSGEETPQQGQLRPAVDLPATGQTLCSSETGTSGIPCAGTGQDGDTLAGISWPTPRFTPISAGTGTVITDNLTGLVWAPDASAPTLFSSPTCTGGPMTWQLALDYVTCLNTNNYLSHNDWRLPNVKELRSLINHGEFSTASWLITSGTFTNVQPDVNFADYWTSTTDAQSLDAGRYVNMVGGWSVSFFKTTGNYYVWPVRGGQGALTAAAKLPKTGQTLCYGATGAVIACSGTGQDGELQNGVAWPGPRFSAGTGAAADCIRDNLTGLMWIKAPDSAKRTWTDALNYANGLSFCGFDDWRLPNVLELESLTNSDYANNSIWLNSLGFSNVQAGFYWSSTSLARGLVNAWAVTLHSGVNNYAPKTLLLYVWPVRSAP